MVDVTSPDNILVSGKLCRGSAGLPDTSPALLDAERKLQTAELKQTQAAAYRYANLAALLQALGEGWWREDCKTSTSAAKAPATQ